MSRKVLVVDDETALLEVISYTLNEAGFEVQTATDTVQAQTSLGVFNPDLIILDIMLPGESGFDFCRRLRQQSDVPIIILSAKTEEVDKVLGLELGADDYVTKPFSPRELVSRVKALLRRAEANGWRQSKIIQIGDLTIDCDSRQVFLKNQSVQLTNSEYQILLFLARNPGKAFSRQAILNFLWGGGFIGDERTIDVHIHNLREKLEIDPQRPKYLLTVRGFGYRLCDPQ
jgi:DNA-binding response OmpR family regulator